MFALTYFDIKLQILHKNLKDDKQWVMKISGYLYTMEILLIYITTLQN